MGRFGLPLLVLVILGGCDLGPDYRRPETPQPSAWLGEAGKSAWPASDWWTGFGSPALDRLMDEARTANPDLAAAVARVRQADAQVRISNAALWPSVQLQANLAQQRELLLGKYQKFTDYTLAPSASYLLDFWQGNRSQVEAAEATARGSRYDQQVIALTIVTDVANSYFQVLALTDRIEVAQRNLRNAQDVLKGVVEQQKVGNGNLLDVVQQQTSVAQVQATIPQLQQQLRQSLNNLAVLVGRLPEDQPGDLTKAPGSLLSTALPAVAPGLPSELLNRRPDVAEAEARLMAANANIRVARAAFFPQITLTAQGGLESSALNTLLRPQSSIYDLAAGLTQPIFEGGALSGQLELTKARYAELVQDYRKSVLSAFGDVENALASTTKTGEQLADQENTVRLARRSFEIAQAQYRVGTVTLLTVLNAQNALFPAEDALVQIRLAHLEALVSLFQALGGGWHNA